MRRCPICKKLVFRSEGTHRCAPKFIVWCPNHGEDTVEDGNAYHEVAPEYAAEAWAEDFDNGDYTIVGGESEVVHVQNEATKEVTRWRVSGETIAQYNATELS